MEWKTYQLPPIDTNAYLLLHQGSQSALLFDAPWHAWRAIEPQLRETEYRLIALLLTHGHWDHVLDVATMAEQGVPVYAHRDDLKLIESPGRFTSSIPPDLALPQGKVDHFLEDGEELTLLGESLEVRHVPGHSRGSVLFYCKKLKMAVTGDAIFAGGIGRTDLPGSSRKILERSIREKIYTLPAETMLYPGHGPPTTVGRERKSNPFVKG